MNAYQFVMGLIFLVCIIFAIAWLAKKSKQKEEMKKAEELAAKQQFSMQPPIQGGGTV